jgi:hypothetical protein
MDIIHVAIILCFQGTLTSALLLPYTIVNELVPTSVSGVAAAGLNMGPYLGSGIYQALSGFILGSPASYAADGTPIYALAAYQAIFVPSVIAGVAAVLIGLLVKETLQKEPVPPSMASLPT